MSSQTHSESFLVRLYFYLKTENSFKIFWKFLSLKKKQRIIRVKGYTKLVVLSVDWRIVNYSRYLSNLSKTRTREIKLRHLIFTLPYLAWKIAWKNGIMVIVLTKTLSISFTASDPSFQLNFNLLFAYVKYSMNTWFKMIFRKRWLILKIVIVLSSSEKA